MDHADDDGTMTIGELAARTGLPVKVVRHWSEMGVVPPAGRTAAGYRLYDRRAVARLALARTLRDLGLGLPAIRAVVSRERDLAEVAAVHADVVEARIRVLRAQLAVLRSAAAHGPTDEELAFMTDLARLSAAERTAIVHRFVTDTLGDLDVPTYRDALLAATPDLPDDPTAEQVDAWIELGTLVRDPALRAALRRGAEYAAEHAPGPHDEQAVAAVRDVAELWVRRVEAAMADRVPADSPAAEPVVAEIVAAWLPTQAATRERPAADGEEARRLLLEQLDLAADPAAERYWQLMCVVNGRPAPPSVAPAGRWLTTALRANPRPGARAARIAELLEDAEDTMDPASRLDACARVLAEVEDIVAAVPYGALGDPTPCAGWNVRALLDHLVWENLMWTALAEGAPRADVDADHLGGDHVAAFRSAAAATLAAFRRPGMLDREYGPARGWRLVEQVVIEMLVHGWDLARATGRSTDLAPDVARAMLPVVEEVYGGVPRTAGGSFGPEQPVPADATPADRVAAYLGRTVG